MPKRNLENQFIEWPRHELGDTVSFIEEDEISEWEHPIYQPNNKELRGNCKSNKFIYFCQPSYPTKPS